MVTTEQGCWIQCQECGFVYHIKEDVPIDKLYITSACPKCDGELGLNCGDNEDDLYVYMNENFDPRFYEY